MGVTLTGEELGPDPASAERRPEEDQPERLPDAVRVEERRDPEAEHLGHKRAPPPLCDLIGGRLVVAPRPRAAEEDDFDPADFVKARVGSVLELL